MQTGAFKGKLGLLAATASLAFSQGAQAQDADLYTYDVQGRLVGVQRPGNVSTTYTLDAADNRQVRTTFNQFDAVWQAESLPHVVGYAIADGWGADPTTSPGYMTYGPYTTGVPVGINTASWRIRVDDNATGGTGNVVGFDVWDATAGVQLGSLVVNRFAWVASGIYQDFEIPFALVSTSSGHQLEFRTNYGGSAAVVVDEIGYRYSGAVWLAATELPHVIGYADANGWAADTSMSPAHMTYGPYAAVSAGARNGVWRMMIDNISNPDTLPVVTLDIWDATANEQLASITLDRHAWAAATTFQDFRIPFVQADARTGHAMELRTFYNGAAKVTVQWIGIE